MSDLTAIDRTIDTLARRLLDSRTASGHWEGRLASSALATAIATVALILHERVSDRDHRDARLWGKPFLSAEALAAKAEGLPREAEASRHMHLIRTGLSWLIAHQNSDGGWGDTTVSFSNLSTTALCWAALSMGRPSDFAHLLQPASSDKEGRPLQDSGAIERAERWLAARVGDLSAASLKRAIVARYGTDRTFSVPILTVLALAGKLDSRADAWRLVPQLPFELAACPHRWFRWMRLPVVSYALPALVAMGQVRHHHAPTHNPLLSAVRSALRSRTLRIARDMQPESGGYLEAVPLTAFVVTSLMSAGAADDSIVTRGLRFLIASARPDGSWPIDTNLATWVTTLSVDALGSGNRLSDDDRRRILQWLLDQQSVQEHPFTHARAGGWAWTDLAGGVPDADDTAGALLALWRLAGARESTAAVAGITWLLDLQNRDGGIPTFCRGWGALPFDRSAPDLTAHALEAWSTWYPAVPRTLQQRISATAQRAVSYLMQEQRPDGSWAPLWFGNQHVAGELNPTYGTARVVSALTAPLVRQGPAAEPVLQRALTWLLEAQNPDGGWGGAAGAPSSVEETGIALHALGSSRISETSVAVEHALARGIRWLIAATDEGRSTAPSPIGLYFARLWYYDELYPLVFGLKGLSQARAVMT